MSYLAFWIGLLEANRDVLKIAIKMSNDIGKVAFLLAVIVLFN